MPEPSMLDADSPAPTVGAAGSVLVRTAFRATFDDVRREITAAMGRLAPLGLSLEEAGAVEIVLAETLNNVVEHAYAPGDPGEIRMVLRHGRAGLLVEIRDDGRPMPRGRAPIGTEPLEVATRSDAPEGGYGWFLIRELARDLIYDRSADENFLIFRMAVGRRPL